MSSAYGGRPSSAGELAARSPGASTCPGANARVATSFFPIFCSGFSSLGSGRFYASPIATGMRRRSRTSLRMPSGINEKAWSVPFDGVTQREVLLDHPRPEHVGDDRHRDPVLVVGEADDEVGVPLSEVVMTARLSSSTAAG